MIKFIRYLFFIFKNTFFIISFVLNIVGVLMVYFGNFEIPKAIFYILLMIGFVLSNYRVYIENSPDISVGTSPLRQKFIDAKRCEENYIDLMVSYNLYINSGNNVGIIEDVQVELVKFSNVKDEYLLDKIGVSFSEYFVSNKKISSPLDFLKRKEAVEFPIIIDPKKTEKKILILYLQISGSDRDDYIRTLNWINDLEFQLLLTIKNNKKIKHKFTLRKQELNEFRIKEEKNKIELEDFLETMSGDR